MWLIICGMPIPILLTAFLLASEGPSFLREMRVIMGTTADVQVTGGADPTALDMAFGALDEVDRTMSLWKESELTALNRAGGGGVSDELFFVLEDALAIAALSGGAFDPTVEPLVRATGGMGGPHRRLSARERTRLLARVGFRRVRLDPRLRSVALDPGTALDLGGIAKGYAVDRALAALRASGPSGTHSPWTWPTPRIRRGPPGRRSSCGRRPSAPRAPTSARTTSSIHAPAGLPAACWRPPWSRRARVKPTRSRPPSSSWAGRKGSPCSSAAEPRGSCW